MKGGHWRQWPFYFMRLILAILILFASPLKAAGLVTDRQLSFGEFAIQRNNSVSSLTVPLSGNSYSTNALRVIRQGHSGLLRLVELPLYTQISITPILPAEGTHAFGSSKFFITALDFPTNISSNGMGVASLPMGGTLETSGDGGTYYDGDYSFVIYLDVTY